MSVVQATIYAVVTKIERPAVEAAAKLLSISITDAGAPIAIDCVFLESLAEALVDGPAIVLSSLLSEVESEEAWPMVVDRLSRLYRQAGSVDDVQLFVCTVLRHVSRDLPSDMLQARRIRIRRLNLLATELSQATNLQVVDIDRSLSDAGALGLKTDYRLGGALAAEATARCIALAFLSAGLDAFVPYEAQEVARAAIVAMPTSWAAGTLTPHNMVRRDLIAVGQGRKKQLISPVVDAVPENHVAWLVRGVLTRQIGFADAYHRLANAIGNRGVRECIRMLMAGSTRLILGGVRKQRAP